MRPRGEVGRYRLTEKEMSKKKPSQADPAPVVFKLGVPTNGPEDQPRTYHTLEPGERLPPEVLAPSYRHLAALFLHFLESQYLDKDGDLTEDEESVLFRAWLWAFKSDAIRTTAGPRSQRRRGTRPSPCTSSSFRSGSERRKR
jgi:hypothetical protein